MIIILGMAGAGKSTQCRKLAERNGYQWFSVGQYLRSIESGEQRAEMMLGKILDDTIVTPLVEAELKRLGDSPEILLDGCPRTVAQAKWLAGQVNTPRVRCVLHLMVDDEVAMERLKLRGREDDSDRAMQVRFAGYHRDIHPVLEEFSIAGVPVFTIDAKDDEEAVYEKIVKVLGSL